MTVYSCFRPLAVLCALSGLATASPLDLAPREKSVWPSAIAAEAHGPSWPQFAAATERWSTYEPPSFNEVFLPRTEEDLSKGLQYLASINRTFLAKSGGHGYSPTLHAIQDAVMINMQNFGKVAMNKDGSVTVGSGATFEQLVDVVGKAGRELTVGACPCVGTMGAMLGGGLGRLQGLHGLTSDALRHVRMATWNGRLVEASEKVNPDLFWGLRGAGQNFGIVVEATYETWPATSGGMQYSADLVFPLTSLEHVWDTTNEILKRGIDPALALMLAVGSDGTTLQTVILVNIVYAGAEAKGKRYAAMYAAGSNASLTEQVTPWTNLSNVALPQVVRAGCARGRRANQYSVMTKTLPTATFRAAADSYSQFVRAHPAANTSVIFIETFGQAALAQLPADSTAFPHRHAFANAVVLSMTYNARADVGSLAADADGWARGWRDRIATVSGYDRLSVYQNYAHDDEPLSALYGYEPWRHQRLSALKAKYDPRGHFNGFHAVPADVSAWS